MRFHIPFTFSAIEVLKERSKIFKKYIKFKKDSKLSENLENCQIDITRKEYVSIAIRTFVYTFLFLYLFSLIFLALLNVEKFYLFGLAFSLLFSGFVFFSQMVYPKIYVSRRQKNIEKNLLAALEDIMVQLNSGIPLFSVLVNISAADYDELSEEFKKAVKKINAGTPEQEALEELSKRNPSIFFKRTLWQISNGMNAGSNMAFVIKDSINALNEEQLIQIQNYGNKLNPLMVFYMLVAVIIPSLSVTFMTILSSMINLSKNTTMLAFLGLFVGVALIQIMFLGIIKSKRPSLL